ncbi:MAG: BON domain-containing protein [Bryobacterales bacterium]
MRTVARMAVMALAVALAASACRGAAPQQLTEQQARLAEQIRKEIVTLPDYSLFDNLSYLFEDGGSTVVLRGQVAKPTLKKSTERVVQRLEGVEKVVNEIEVLPNSPNDEQVRAGVYVRVYGHPTLSRYNPNRGTPLFSSTARRSFGISSDPPPGRHPIHIIVKNANVTLEGVVDTEGDKTIAGLQANSTPGAFSVTNNLVVRKAGE